MTLSQFNFGWTLKTLNLFFYRFFEWLGSKNHEKSLK